jgi:hypothetical protein
MPKPRPPYLHRQKTRHGQVAWYVRRGHGLRIRIKAEYDSPAFWAEYQAALAGAPKASKSARAHTLAWGIDRYRESSAWAALSNATRRQSENIYRAVVKTAGDVLARDITTETIKSGRERRAAAPHAANNFLKAMRRFFKWAADDEGGKLVAINPTIGVKLLQGKNRDGFHTWTNEEIQRFEQRWPVGMRERLALDLLLYTGIEPRRRCSARPPARQQRGHHFPNGEGPRRWRRLSADPAGPSGDDRGLQDRRPHVPGYGTRCAFREGGLRQLVS